MQRTGIHYRRSALTVFTISVDVFVYGNKKHIGNPDTSGTEVRCPHFNVCKSGTWGGKRCPV